MARRGGSDESAVSLFSFLDIIACLIGVLTLILIILILSIVDPTSIEAAEQKMAEAQKRAEALKKLQDELAPLEKQKEEIEQTIKQAEQLQEQIDQLNEKIEEIEAENQGDAQQLKMSRELEKQLKELEKKKEQIEQQQKEMEDKVKEMESELSERTKAAQAPEVQIQPGGSGESLNPFFVEVTAKNIIIYGMAPEPIEVPPAQIREGPEFKALMDRVKGTENGTIIFLMRSDALGMYYLAYQTAQNNYVRNGKLPVIGEGDVNLKAFEEQIKRNTPPTSNPQ